MVPRLRLRSILRFGTECSERGCLWLPTANHRAHSDQQTCRPIGPWDAKRCSAFGFVARNEPLVAGSNFKTASNWFQRSFPPGLARPAAHETLLPWCLCRRHRGRCFLGAIKPAKKLDPGFLEHLRLSPRAILGPGARILDFLIYGTPRRRRNRGGDNGAVASTLLWP
jgi:hypothetical protein